MTRSRPPLRQRLRDRPPSQALWRLCGFALANLVNAWMARLNYRAALYEPAADLCDEFFQGPCIYLFWHEYIPFPFYLRPNSRLAMLVSQHQDAEFLSHAAHFAGLEAVRGSTHRGGVAALREMLLQGRGKNLAITPDGPRGPRRKLAQGCIYLSSRLGVPLVPLGIGYDSPWRHPTAWDKFAIPRPFSRARAICGPKIQIPPDLDRDQIEIHRVWIEQVLNQLTELAESWASGDLTIRDSRTLFRKPACNQQPMVVPTTGDSRTAVPQLRKIDIREAS